MTPKEREYLDDPGRIPDHEFGMFNPKKLAKTTDPETSKLAVSGAGFRSAVETHERLILECLKKHGRGTADEIADRISKGGHPMDGVDVSRRMGKLEKSKQVEAFSRNGLSAKGKRCTIWKLKEEE